MANIQARVVLPFRTNLPEDVTVNTYAFVVPALDEPSFTAVGSRLLDLYNNPGDGGDLAITEILSPALNRETEAARLEVYEIDLDTGAVGSPLFVQPFTLGSGPVSASNLLPNEVAICSSFSAGPISGVPAARRRGRVFLGPLVKDVCTNDADTFQPTLTDGTAEDVAASFATFANGLLEDDVVWSVWSRADEVLYPINRGWVDREFDTQRRRGLDATTRAVWDLDAP